MTQETEDTSGQPPTPLQHHFPPSPSPNGDISLEASLSNVSLGSPSSDAGPSRSPRLSNGRRTPPAPLELSREDDIDPEVEGDIGVSLTSPTRTSSPSIDYFSVSPSARRSSSRLDHVLARSPSPSPSSIRERQRSLTPNGHLEVSPTKVPLPSPTSLSPPLSAPPSRRSFSLRSISSRSPSPPPQPFALKPPLPNVTSVILSSEQQGEVEVDDSAPFESIPLSSTPPLTPTVPPSISPTYVSPERKGRQSWGGFGMTKEGQRYAIGETPDHTRSQTEQIRRTSATSSIHSTHANTPSVNGNGNGNGIEATSPPPNGESSASTPRLHAPPAHPFPFPIPSEPYSEDQRRISTSQPQQQNHTSGQGGSGVESHEHGIGVKETISTFEKVRSHTRPAYLPPKDKHEDEVHLHQWEEIMTQSREHEKQVRKLKEQRKLEREKKLSIVIPKWEALLHDREFSVQKVQNDPGLRNMWFEGVPTHLRGLAWTKAIGNPLAVSKDAYRTYVTRSEKAQKSGRFPQDVLDQMEKDMDNTLPTLRLYHRGSPLRDDLKEIMCAWVVYRSDDGLGYAPYISHLSAMFLLVSPPAEAFISLINLLCRPCLRSFYTQTDDEIDAYYRVLENLQADAYPKIYANLKNLGLRVPESWFRGMLVEQVDFECACRLWDQIMLDGDGFIFRTALAIFGFLEPRLYYPDHDEILSVLEGRNPATLAIQARERERAKLRGETFDDLIDGRLSVFGLNEHTLFEWLGDDGWREKAFERLVLREMPD